jgi:hypothetical protein
MRSRTLTVLASYFGLGSITYPTPTVVLTTDVGMETAAGVAKNAR